MSSIISDAINHRNCSMLFELWSDRLSLLGITVTGQILAPHKMSCVTMYVNFVNLTCVFLLFVVGNSVVDNSCDSVSGYICSNSPNPCQCTESQLNCEICRATDEIPCSQCISGYFRPFDDYKCVSCDEIFGSNCEFCTNNLGCQQCNDGSQPQKNECGLYTCDEIEITEATTPSPVFIMTEEIWISQVVDFFRAPVNTTFHYEWQVENYSICIDELGCGGREFGNKLLGICDIDAIGVTKNLIIRGNRHFFSDNYISCLSSVNGLFFINSVEYTEADPNSGLYIQTRLNFMDETDTEYIKEYMDSH